MRPRLAAGSRRGRTPTKSPYSGQVGSAGGFTWPSDPVLLDGGLATELEARGHDLSDPLWSARLLADAPQEIVAVHAAYFRAGAMIATTASYQASFEGFAARGISRSDTAGLLRRSVELAKAARDEAGVAGYVAASVGPYGAALADGSEYRGRYGLSVRQLEDWHRPRLEVLADADADVLAAETIPDVDEAEALVNLVRSLGVPAWLSYTIDGAHTRAGARDCRFRRQLLRAGRCASGDRAGPSRRQTRDRVSQQRRTLGWSRLDGPIKVFRRTCKPMDLGGSTYRRRMLPGAAHRHRRRSPSVQ